MLEKCNIAKINVSYQVKRRRKRSQVSAVKNTRQGAAKNQLQDGELLKVNKKLEENLFEKVVHKKVPSS